MAVPLIQAAPLDPQSAAASKPNFVMILADDLGNVDLGYRGSDIKTPNIDALAKDGVRLENFHGMPVCTPARAALMTGRYPMRQGLQTLAIFLVGRPMTDRVSSRAAESKGGR
jgi:arylsulfatase A-like enzyme